MAFFFNFFDLIFNKTYLRNIFFLESVSDGRGDRLSIGNHITTSFGSELSEK